MPAVVVELAYHSNATDAAALQDPVFQRAAMKGVEKGYRLHAEGKPCEPFKITSIPDVATPNGTTIPVDNHYIGYPQFPVVRRSEVVSCPSNFTCIGSEVTYDNGSSPLRSTASCQALSQGTIRLRVTMTDADEVQTDPIEFNLTCTSAAQRGFDVAPADRRSTSIGTG